MGSSICVLFLLTLLTAVGGSSKSLQKTVVDHLPMQTKETSFNRTKTTRRQQLRMFLGYCSNGNEAVASCFPNHICGRGYWCDQAVNRCCRPRIININIHFVKGPMDTAATTSAGSLICRDGSPATSKCPTGRCPMGYICSMDRLCCRSGTAASCNFEGEPVGLCYQGMCDAAHYCSKDGYCCPKRPRGPSVGICPDGQTPTSLCLDGLCPTGHECIDGRYCCPFTFYESQMSECPGNVPAVGPCVDGLCPDEFACVNNLCCPVYGEDPWYNWQAPWDRYPKGYARQYANKFAYKGKI